ncbi:unnamed protein product [Ranitomeya imitator]|uniref:Helix-turn-helix domain-containing protein n=1 Tax=Ranitomeya imitator TaxID=111125 RepID=A0ABN9KZB6_9NEOB|nr:unnamed protein product [Ranitomeya imitator]
MAFSMLSYNQDEATSIISQITTPGTFLHTPTEELRTRDFEKDLKRFTALDLHSITLAEYHRVQRIPRGLRVPLRPTLFQDNTEFCGKFEAILNKCSMDLIVLTIDFLQKEITDLKTKISSTEQQQLKSTSSPEDFKSLKDKVDKTISDLRDSLQSRKCNKFLRDTEDYKNNQVYRWQSSNYSRNRRFTRRDYSPLSTSSESDFGTTRTSFFRATPKPSIQRKTRRGKRVRIRTSSDDDQISGIEEINNIVYNISSQCLSPTQMTVLQKGLSFCPVPRFNTFLVDQELHRFFRNVRLKAHFSRIPERVSAVTASSEPIFKLDNLKLRVRSSFQPPRIYHPVETYVDFVKQDVKSVLESIEQGQIHVKQNLTRDEHLALVSLKNNRQLIIKPADKGGSIVVLDRDYYMQEIRTQLSDLGTYRLVSSNPTFDIARYYQCFYTLPKIHKHSTRPPGRPIVASTNSLLSPLAITLEKILSPLIHHNFWSHFKTWVPCLRTVYYTSSMNFLDTLFSSIRETDLYVKPTDRNSLLKFVSCHPKHIKVSLPRSQHARIDRIVSKPDVCRMRHHEMDSKFRTRGYPTHVLDTQQRIIRTREKHNVPRIAFVSTYHPFNHLINSCVTRHWDILGKAYPQVEEFLIKPIISNKRCPNLRDCLIRADVGSSVREISQRVFSTPRNGTFPCLSCHQCSNITKGDSFTHPRSGQKVPNQRSFHLQFILCYISH